MATTEKYYLITEKELDRVRNDCYYPTALFCDGCEYNDPDGIGCKFILQDLYDKILKRPAGESPHHNNTRRDALDDAIKELTSNLNERDRYWKGLTRAIDLIESMKEG
jgi:hypothetical protein